WRRWWPRRPPACPNWHACRARPTSRAGLDLPIDLVPPRTTIGVAAPSAPRASGETEGRRAYGARLRNLAHRYHVIRLLDGTPTYLHAVIDNFSRRILAWRVADTFAPLQQSRPAARRPSTGGPCRRG